jgi:hypothetical protein
VFCWSACRIRVARPHRSSQTELSKRAIHRDNERNRSVISIQSTILSKHKS